MSNKTKIKIDEVISKITPLPWSTPHFVRENVNCSCGYMLCDSLMGAVATIHKGDDENEGDDPLPPSAIANAQYLPHAANSFPNLVEALGRLLEWSGKDHKKLKRHGIDVSGERIMRDLNFASKALVDARYISED